MGGLNRHDNDAVHCTHGGSVLPISNEGIDQGSPRPDAAHEGLFFRTQ
jgi:hypothetical protein